MLARKLWSPKLTVEVIAEAVRRGNAGLDNPGFCLVCGNEQDGCEPDAENYECVSCGAEQVFGAEQLLISIV